MKIYFLHREQQLQGPYTLDEIRSQHLSEDDIIWKDGAEEMVRAIQLEEFACMFSSTPVPVESSQRKAGAHFGRFLGWRR